MKCQNCSWSWDLESDDDNPHLCHKCGYDDDLGDFDMDSLQKWEKENNHPFGEIKENGYHIRTFSNETNSDELVWHRDREDRLVESIGDTNWMIQLDNEIPKPLTERTLIPKEVYHRVIKGDGDLKVRIKKL
jgi:hypothetical protein